MGHGELICARAGQAQRINGEVALAELTAREIARVGEGSGRGEEGGASAVERSGGG